MPSPQIVLRFIVKPLYGPTGWKYIGLPAAGQRSATCFMVTQEEVVFHRYPFYWAAGDFGGAHCLILDKEALAAVVVQVVLAEDDVIATPNRLQTV